MSEEVLEHLRYVSDVTANAHTRKGKSQTKNDDFLKQLESRLTVTKKTLVKQVLISRSIERSILQNEVINKALNEHVSKEVSEGRLITTLDRKVNNSKRLAAGATNAPMGKRKHLKRNIQDKKMWIDESNLHDIEKIVDVPRGIAVTTQRLYNSYNDESMKKHMASVPEALLEQMDLTLLAKIVVAASQGFLNNADAKSIYDVVYKSSNNNSNNNSVNSNYNISNNNADEDGLDKADQWYLTCRRIEKCLMIYHLGVGLLKQHIDHFQINNNLRQTISARSMSADRLPSINPSSSPNKKSLSSIRNELMSDLNGSKSKQKSLQDKIISNLSLVSQQHAINGDTHASALRFAKTMAIRKMEQVLMASVRRTWLEYFTKWKATCNVLRACQSALRITQFIGAFRLFSAMEAVFDKKLDRGLQRLIECKKFLEDMEIHACVLEIQKVWRGGLGYRRVWRLKQKRAIIRIQKVSRGYIVRKKFRDIKLLTRQKKSIKIIEAAYKKYLVQKTIRKVKLLKKQTEKVGHIQRVWRGHVGRNKIKAKKLALRKQKGCLKIQTLWRRYISVLFVDLKRLNLLKKDNAIKIQLLIRRFLAGIVVQDKRERKGACLRIQCLFRTCKARRVVKGKRRNKAAVVIQKTIYRGRQGRKRFARFKQKAIELEIQKKNTAKFMSRFLLGWICRRKVLGRLKAYKLRRRKAVINIQRVARGRQGRMRVAVFKDERIAIYRARELVKKKEKKAREIQRVARGFVGRRKANRKRIQWAEAERRRLANMPAYYRLKDQYYRHLAMYYRKPVVKIQSWLRGNWGRRRVKGIRAVRAIELIQRGVRLFFILRDSRAKLKELRLLKKKKVKSAVHTQRIVRGFLARYEFKKHEKANIVKWFIKELQAVGMIGKALMNFRIRKRHMENINRQATKIQALGRRYNSRCWFFRNIKRLNKEKAYRIKLMKEKKATKIQATYRMFKTHEIVTAKKKIQEQVLKEQKLVAELDAMIESLHGDWMQEILAIRVQCGGRVMLAKAKIQERIEQLKVEQAAKQKDLKDRMATKIQALARGMKGRARFTRLAPMLRKENALREMCSECEIKKATRKCIQCKDRFCEVCYMKMHKKGFRKTHTYQPLGKVGPGGVITVDGDIGGGGGEDFEGNQMATQAGKGGRNQATLKGGKSAAAAGGGNNKAGGQSKGAVGKNAKDAWKEYFDKEAGAKYWHNEETGEAVWTKPY